MWGWNLRVVRDIIGVQVGVLLVVNLLKLWLIRMLNLRMTRMPKLWLIRMLKLLWILVLNLCRILRLDQMLQVMRERGLLLDLRRAFRLGVHLVWMTLLKVLLLLHLIILRYGRNGHRNRHLPRNKLVVRRNVT